MTEVLQSLVSQRARVLEQFAELGDLRPGSVLPVHRRCGKPNCHCAQPKDPGHGPDFRLTYKVQGKTVTETLPNDAAVRKAQREIGEFRRFQELSDEFIQVNQKICRLRPTAEPEGLTAQQKEQPKRSARKSRAK
jgi:hypothetical protein